LERLTEYLTFVRTWHVCRKDRKLVHSRCRLIVLRHPSILSLPTPSLTGTTSGIISR